MEFNKLLDQMRECAWEYAWATSIGEKEIWEERTSKCVDSLWEYFPISKETIEKYEEDQKNKLS